MRSVSTQLPPFCTVRKLVAEVNSYLPQVLSNGASSVNDPPTTSPTADTFRPPFSTERNHTNDTYQCLAPMTHHVVARLYIYVSPRCFTDQIRTNQPCLKSTKEKQISGLWHCNTCKIVFIEEDPQEAKLLYGRSVLTLKHVEKAMTIFKARFVVQEHCDE